jgi:hypothetical protein
MRLRIKAPAPRSVHSPSRTAVRAVPWRRLQVPAAPPLQARRRGPRHGERSAQNPHPQALDRRSGRAARSTPLIPLTLRAMFGMRRHPARSSGRPAFLLLSVLALLALALPVLAQAEEPVGAVYEPEVPKVKDNTGSPTKKSNNQNNPPAESSTTGGTPSGSAGGPGSGSGSGGPSAEGGNPSTGNDDGTGQGSQGNGTTAKQQGGSVANGQPASTQSSSDSSSPLVPILIAIAALAAISIAAVVIRQRRQRRGPGARVSPKAS